MTRFRFGLFAIVAVALLFSAHLAVTRARGDDMIVIEGATLIDGTGKAPMENSVILIEDGVIRKISKEGDRHYPPEAKIIDAHGKTVIPGLFDIDTHIGQQGLEAAAQAMSNYLYHGITTICDTGVTVLYGPGLEKFMKEGKLLGPRILEAGPTFTAVGGHPIPTNRALGREIDTRTLTQVDNPESAIEQVRRYVREYQVVVVKAAMESGGELGYPRMTAKTYKAFVEEAHRQHLRVYTHASQLSDVRDALAGGVDVIAHGFSEELTADSDITKTMLKQKTSWIPAVNNGESALKLFDHPEIWDDPQVRKAIPARYIEMARDPETLARVRPRLESSRNGFQKKMRTVKALYDAGINILVGTDSTGAPHRMFYGWDIHREMEHLVNAGMKPMDVLVAATRKAAEFVGREAELGTVQVGRSADLVILSKNPLEDIRNTRTIQTVMYRGRVIDRDNLPMLDPFKDGLVATGKVQQQITNQDVDKALADRFPAADGKDQVLRECSGCHSLKVVLDGRKSSAEWQTVVFGMLGKKDSTGEAIVKYLSAHFGK